MSELAQPPSLMTPIKKKSRSSSSATTTTSVLAIDCCKILVAVDGSQRFVCKHPGCNREYASRDAVRKHCRLRHLQWLRGLDRTATTDVEVAPPPESGPSALSPSDSSATSYDTPLPPPPPLTSTSPAQAEAAPPQMRQPPVAQAVVARQDQTLLPGGFAPSPAMGPMFATSPPASPAFVPQSPMVVARMPSLSVLSPIVMPHLPGSHEMAYLPPLDLPTYACSAAMPTTTSAAAAASGLSIHTNSSWSYVKGVGSRTLDLLKTGLSPRPAPPAASAAAMSGQQAGSLLKPMVALHA